MAEQEVLLPDGTPFEFWDDATQYERVYHVACSHPDSSDENPGTEGKPFATINKAAAVLQAGEKVIVHEGTYRECVRPARGGEGPERMIAYEAAPGEEVVVKGSELWQPEFRASEGWRTRRAGSAPAVWMADLPADWFAGYNPFVANNMSAEFRTFGPQWTPEQTHRFQLRRGMIVADGRPLRQVFWYRDLTQTDGAFWVEDPGLRIHLRLWDNADPNGATFEVTAREQVFAPSDYHLGYIRLSGFTFEHAADGVPIPQRAMVSAMRGHHWI
ncbi:MAG: right-handed parallel beta-helix repeat-containing protein, partial [Candidatus Brocadiae bacterium]|nr:right-handed parallel beta-helix repeat-containing protein [Candidatus Brocadiia bacterium]